MPGDFFTFLTQNPATLLRLSLLHLALVVSSVALAAAVAIPLAVWSTRAANRLIGSIP